MCGHTHDAHEHEHGGEKRAHAHTGHEDAEHAEHGQDQEHDGEAREHPHVLVLRRAADDPA